MGFPTNYKIENRHKCFNCDFTDKCTKLDDGKCRKSYWTKLKKAEYDKLVQKYQNNEQLSKHA